MSKPLNEYIMKKETTSDLNEVMTRRKNAKAQELESLQFDALIAEEKKKIQDSTPNKIDPAQTTSFAAMIFAGRKPEEIKQILSTLTQDEIDRLAYMASSMNPNNFANFRGLMQAPSTSTKDIIEIVKLVGELQQPRNQGANDMSGMAKAITEAFKAGIEASKVQQPANSQGDIQFKLVEKTLDELKATREEMARQDRSRTDKEIAELRSRPSGMDELFNSEEKVAKARKIFGGTDSGTANEFTLKKEEMQQKERIETRKLDLEEKLLDHKLANEGKTLETVKDIAKIVGEGPIGKALESIGAAGADRIRGSKTSTPNSQAQSPQIVQAKCPNCAGSFPANNQLPTIQCPLCGVKLQNNNQPLTQQEQTPPQEQTSNATPQSKAEPVVEKPADKQSQEQPAPASTQQPSQPATPQEELPYIENHPEEKPAPATQPPAEAEPVVEKPADKQ